VKVLVTGASGQVGRALQANVPADVELRAFTRSQLDISDAAAVNAAVAAFRPGVLINAAAYTAVDKAESEPELAQAINAQGPRLLALAVKSLPASRLLHISTDYVFDGSAAGAYLPADATNPLSAYGRSKLLGERAVLEVLGTRGVVLRTAWVYADQGKNFLLTMLRLMRERGAVRVVADQYGTPTSAASIARALWAIAKDPKVHGILHWTDTGRASWYEFAVAIAEDARAAGLLSSEVKVTPITTADYPTLAHRPANSALDSGETVTQLGFAPPPWRENLRATLAHIGAG
jgi:dTDP-4-dehydrorhamnose reductase